MKVLTLRLRCAHALRVTTLYNQPFVLGPGCFDALRPIVGVYGYLEVSPDIGFSKGRCSLSTEMVEKEILEFLSTDDPEVLCLSGRWGVGKTFAWNKYAQHASRANLIAFGRYAYVSLFGIGSLDELKYSIFQNTIQASQIGIEPSLDTLRSNTGATAEKLGRKSIWFFEHLPLVKNYVAGLGPVWFLSVSKTIICLDDIERRGKTLDVRDVMGLVATEGTETMQSCAHIERRGTRPGQAGLR